MAVTLPYGPACSLELDLAPERLLAQCLGPEDPAVEPARAVAEVLDKPLDFPPLVQCTVPGDQITVALGPGVPQAATVAGAVIRALLHCGNLAENITLLVGPEDAATGASLLGELAAGAEAEVELLVHDPDHAGELAFLGETADHMPIRLNRALVDADVVLPVGCLQAAGTAGYNGPGGTICPHFADAAARRRFRAWHAAEVSGEHAARSAEKPIEQAREVAHLLGVYFTVQVVPARGEQVLEVLAGDVRSVEREGGRRCEQAWACDVPRRAELVIAAVGGDAAGHTWEQVGRAARAALQVVEEGGAIVVCSQLSEEPGEALHQLAAAPTPHEVIRALREGRPADCVPAVQLARALDRCSVYLLSRLPAAQVEDLGLTAVAGEQQLAHLAEDFQTHILIGDAQHAAPRVK